MLDHQVFLKATQDKKFTASFLQQQSQQVYVIHTHNPNNQSLKHYNITVHILPTFLHF